MTEKLVNGSQESLQSGGETNLQPQPQPGIVDNTVDEGVNQQPAVMVTTKKLLVRRDKATGEVVTQQLLFDNNETEHIIIDSLPEAEEKPGFALHYIVDTQGKVTVKYTELPKTNEQILMETNAKLMIEVAQIKAQLAKQSVGGEV